jgi:hypothetical protein
MQEQKHPVLLEMLSHRSEVLDETAPGARQRFY